MLSKSILLLTIIIIFVIYSLCRDKLLSPYKKLLPDNIDNITYNNNYNNNYNNTNYYYKKNNIINNNNNISFNNNNISISSYLNTFLRGIKIFGYLNNIVFNQLTKNMKTQKLEKNQIFLLDDSMGFILLIEGTLQLYSKKDIKSNTQDYNYNYNSDTDTSNSSYSSSSDDENQYYDSPYIQLKDNLGDFQLLNTIKSGMPVSSLVNILNLFTNDYDDNTSPNPFDTLHDINDSSILIRAQTDSTIAIIPPNSFKKLTKKFPKSSSHIIQLIITKLFRVTLQISNNYLNLTNEIMNSEFILNDNLNFLLPNYLKNLIIIKKNETNNNSINSINNNNPGDLISSVPLSHNNSSSNSSTNFNTDIHPDNDLSILHSTLADAFFLFLGVNKDTFSLQNNTNKNFYSNSNDSLTSSSSSSSSISNENNLKFIPKDLAILTNSSSISNNNFFNNNKKKKRILSNNNSNSNSHSNLHTNNYNNKNHNSSSSFYSQTFYNEFIDPNLSYESAKSDLTNSIEIKFFKKGSNLVKQNSSGKGLFYIIDGKLEITKNSNSNKQIHLFNINTGGIAGFLSSLIGYKSFVNINAKTNVYVAFLSNNLLESLCDKYISIYLSITKTLISLLSKRILKIDHALEWVHLSSNEILFNQNDQANGIYVLLNGRIREFKENETNKNEQLIIKELTQGQTFGELEVLTSMNRMSSIVAIRDSELARIPKSLFELLAIDQPSLMFKVTRTVAKKIVNNFNFNTNSNFLLNDNFKKKYINNKGLKYDFNLMIPPTKFNSSTNNNTNNFKTFTILPISPTVPVEDFAMELVTAFKQVGRSTIMLNQRTAISQLGKHAFDGLAKLKQSGFFTELEENYEIVVYIADTPSNSRWTNTCITQGDCVLLIADANQDPSIGEMEKIFLKNKNSSRTELILLHPERYVEPGSTIKWLKLRNNWVQAHHHIQFALPNLNSHQNYQLNSTMNFIAMNLVDKLIQTEFGKKTQHNISKLVPDSFKNRVENISLKFLRKKNKFYIPVHSHKNDFLRLARILSGQAIGLVLGGGGARGFAHLGIIQALEENGIPVDLVGGTSMGSFVGGLYARDYDIVPIYGRMKKFAGRISSIWRTLSDLTWPVTSYTTGHEFNRGIWKSFGDTRIEDFWIQYYCNSTNITESVQEIHSMGYAWRYIRASMTIAGLLPPLIEKGSMLLDGGYVDNLPVDEMKARGCDNIFAVDVGSNDDRTPLNYGDSLNGFWALWNNWNPFSSRKSVPTMADIQVRLAYVSSVNALEKSKMTPGVVYMRPPVENYGTLAFGQFEEIYNVGADYGRSLIKDLVKKDQLPLIAGQQQDDIESSEPKYLMHRRNSI